MPAAKKETQVTTEDTIEEKKDGPLIDTSDRTVKSWIRLGKKRGYITYDELNEILPSDEVSSEQIEDIMAGASPRTNDDDDSGNKKKRYSKEPSISDPANQT